MNKDRYSFQHISSLFPLLLESKKIAGFFTWPPVRLMLQRKELEDKMTTREAGAWKLFREVVQNFLGNKRSYNYKLLGEQSDGGIRKMSLACPCSFEFFREEH